MYQNPIELEIEGIRQNIGDPFVLKYNGMYYLYYSTEHNQIGINCFKSTDLTNWEYCGLVTEDPITLNAYAPEVIYYKDKFILITSPSGHGHYIFEANSPLGPFVRKTGNVGRMIDGSFFQEGDRLFLLVADHAGITLHEVDSAYNIKNRINIEAELNGWTEGPFLIKEDDLYYLTYCGNHLESKGYRVEYSVSSKLEGPYIKGSNSPLLISTHPDFNSLGHSAMVKGPNLTTYYNLYHYLKLVDKGHQRDYCVDEISINGKIMKQNITNFPVETPQRPDFEIFEGDTSSNLALPVEVENNYRIELNFYKNITLHIGDYMLNINENQIQLVKSDLEANSKLTVNESLNKLEIINDGEAKILLNNDYLFTLENTSSNSSIKISEVYKLGYVACSYKKKESIQYLPNLVFSENYDFFNHKHQFNVSKKILKSTLSGDGEYALSLLLKVINDVKLKITIGDYSSNIHLHEGESPYEFNKVFINKVKIEGINQFTVEVLDGDCHIAYADFERMAIHEGERLTKDKFLEETYILHTPKGIVNEFKAQINVSKSSNYSRFGLIINGTNYSEFPYQTQFPIQGYFIGIYKNLLVVDKLNYGIKRIFDIPLEVEREFEIKAVLNGNKIEVYINNDLKISCYDNYIRLTGQYGFYSNETTELEVKNYKLKLQED